MGGFPSGGGGSGGPPAITTYHPANPTGTTNTGAILMMGLGSTITYTPVLTGKLWVCFTCQGLNNTANDGGALSILYGTGTAPANQAAATGTPMVSGWGSTLTPSNATGVAVSGKITGLALNTPVWVDAGIQCLLGGSASILNITCSIMECN